MIKSEYTTTIRGVPTPLDRGADLSSRTDHEEKLDLSQYPHRRIVGKLNKTICLSATTTLLRV